MRNCHYISRRVKNALFLSLSLPELLSPRKEPRRRHVQKHTMHAAAWRQLLRCSNSDGGKRSNEKNCRERERKGEGGTDPRFIRTSQSIGLSRIYSPLSLSFSRRNERSPLSRAAKNATFEFHGAPRLAASRCGTMGVRERGGGAVGVSARFQGSLLLSRAHREISSLSLS